MPQLLENESLSSAISELSCVLLVYFVHANSHHCCCSVARHWNEQMYVSEEIWNLSVVLTETATRTSRLNNRSL